MGGTQKEILGTAFGTMHSVTEGLKRYVTD
jgi:hypothetical protein